jgi:WD40 repeat protein
VLTFSDGLVATFQIRNGQVNLPSVATARTATPLFAAFVTAPSSIAVVSASCAIFKLGSDAPAVGGPVATCAVLNGQTLVVGADDGSIRVADASTCDVGWTQRVHSSSVALLEVAADVVASADNSPSLRFTSLPSGRSLTSFSPGHAATSVSVRTNFADGALAPISDSPFVIFTHKKGGISVWDCSRQVNVQTTDGHHADATCVAVPPRAQPHPNQSQANQNLFFTGGEDGTARVWRVVEDFQIQVRGGLSCFLTNKRGKLEPSRPGGSALKNIV